MSIDNTSCQIRHQDLSSTGPGQKLTQVAQLDKLQCQYRIPTIVYCQRQDSILRQGSTWHASNQLGHSLYLQCSFAVPNSRMAHPTACQEALMRSRVWPVFIGHGGFSHAAHVQRSTHVLLEDCSEPFHIVPCGTGYIIRSTAKSPFPRFAQFILNTSHAQNRDIWLLMFGCLLCMCAREHPWVSARDTSQSEFGLVLCDHAELCHIDVRCAQLS